MQPELIALDHKQPATTLKTEISTTELFVNLGMRPKRSKTWVMKWHWLRENEVLDQLRVYFYRETRNNVNYFTNNHPPIHLRQIQTQYIHTSKLVRIFPQTIRLCKDVLNQVPGTQSHVKYLEVIRAEPQSTTKKYHTVRWLNRPRQHIM